VTIRCLLYSVTGTSETTIKMMQHFTVAFVCCIHLYCLLLSTHDCCHLLVGKMENNIQESLHSKEYYHEEKIRSEKQQKGDKIGEEISPVLTSSFVDCPRKSGTYGYNDLVFYLHSDSLRTGRSGDRIPVKTRFSAAVHNGPGAHTASSTIATESLSQQ
jgi:hypothetical protein